VAALAAAVGFALLTPLGGDLEEVYGLDALLQLRGAASPPPGVTIISIDRASAEKLGLPAPPRPWPRSMHAKLLSQLGEYGTAAIVFDLLFAEERSDTDNDLAAAMQHAGNIALLQGLERRSIAPAPAGGGKNGAVIDLVVDPASTYSDAAVAVAPFPLPRDEARVTRFWTFRPGTDVPTLPSVALHLSSKEVMTEWASVASLADNALGDPQAWRDRRLVGSISSLRHRLKTMPGEADRMRRAIAAFEPDKARRLSVLLALYTGEDNRLLNFRGPAGTISMLSYSSLMETNGATQAKIAGLKGKTVLVGLADREVAGQQDTYETAFSNKSAVNLSGVEILATGLSDLMEDATLKTSATFNALLVAGVALVLGLAAASASMAVLAGVSFALPFAVFGLGYAVLVSADFALAVFVPTAIELPVGAITAALLLRNTEKKLRQKIDGAIRQFLPRDIADTLAEGPRHAAITAEGQIRYAVCLETDAQGFMTVSERLSPQALHRLLNEYYPPLFAVTERYGGNIVNIIGDSMLCSWTGEGDRRELRTRAVQAAVEMLHLVEAFNARHSDSPLPTRFGMHAGLGVLGAVGGAGHFSAALVGDVANTAARIESLNKHLNTRILASDEVIAGLDGFVTRPLGSFVLAGKAEAVAVSEILGTAGDDSRGVALAQAFAEALAAYDREDWPVAVERLRELARNYPADGPTAFFLSRAERYLSDPPPRGSHRPIQMRVK
jgi:adenylate cyclase